MKLKLKSIKTGEIKEVTEKRWNLMTLDGRSRLYTVVSDAKKQQPKEKPIKEKIEIKAIEIPEKKQEEQTPKKLNKDEGTD